MLQPHSYSQIIRPNLYNVDYKRVGAYKGMGQTDLSTLPDLPVPAPPPLPSSGTFMTPQGPVNISDNVYAGSAAPTTTGINWTYLAIGGVAFLLLLMAGRR